MFLHSRPLSTGGGDLSFLYHSGLFIMRLYAMRARTSTRVRLKLNMIDKNIQPFFSCASVDLIRVLWSFLPVRRALLIVCRRVSVVVGRAFTIQCCYGPTWNSVSEFCSNLRHLYELYLAPMDYTRRIFHYDHVRSTCMDVARQAALCFWWCVYQDGTMNCEFQPVASTQYDLVCSGFSL